MMKKYLSLALALLFVLFMTSGARTADIYNDGEIVIDSTNLYPKTDGGSSLGKSGNEFADVFTDAITLGGVQYTSLALGSDGNWTSDGTTLTVDSAPTKFIATFSSGDFNAWQFTTKNGEVISNSTDDTVDIASDGASLIVSMTTPNASNGTVTLNLVGDAGADATDRFQIKNNANGTLTFANDSSVAGTYVTKLTLSSAGVLTLADSETITNASDVVTIGADDAAATLQLLGYEGNTAVLQLYADQDDDATDGWTITATDSATGTLTIANDSSVAGTPATKVTIAGSTGTISLVNSETIGNATNGTITLSGATGMIVDVLDSGTSDSDATLSLSADAAADNGDVWRLTSDGTTNSLFFENNTSGSQATILTLANTGVLTTTSDIIAVNDTSTTNAVQDILRLTSSTTGTAAASLGAGLVFYVEDAGDTEEQGSIDVVMTTNTNNSEDADIVFSVNTAGSIAEVGRFVAASSATAGDYFKITQNTTETDAVVDGLVLANVTGTATTGMGMGISYAYEDAGGAEEQGSIDNALATATNAAEDSYFAFNVQCSGTIAEAFRIYGDSSATAGSYIKATTNTSETDAVLDAVIITESAVTGATGNGLGISFQPCDAGGAEEQGSIDSVLTTATNGSEMADLVFSQNTAGTIAETLRLVAASSATTSDYLQFTANTTETNGLTNVMVLKTATGTATDNYGISISFQPEDATGSEEQARIDILETTAARATNDTDFVFTQNVNGTLTERVRFDADGSNITLSGATPAITVGDGGDEDTGIYLNSDTTDYYIASENTLDDLLIGVGSAIGTTPAIGVNGDGDVHVYQDLVVDKTINFALDTSTSDDYVISLPYAPTAYTLGMQITFQAVTANTGACAVNVNSLGLKSLKTTSREDPSNNWIIASGVVMAVYDGTNFQMMQPKAGN